MTSKLRGADVVARTLEQVGPRTVFTLSGNHIMPLFDAALGTKLRLIHTRHEAAAVHMADAYARLKFAAGIALVTGGQGHTNAIAALTTAQCAESSVVLLSGHAAVKELGRGAFQELAQAEMARPVTKASWTAHSAETLGHEVAKAISTAQSGRPGPVHLSLPIDLLEASLQDGRTLWPAELATLPPERGLSDAAANTVIAALARAKRPLILGGPTLGILRPGVLESLQNTLRVPAICMESPRGINDPALGAFAEVLSQADLIILLGKPHDFTLRFAEPPHVNQRAEFIIIDADPALIERATRQKYRRIVASLIADAHASGHDLWRAATESSYRSDFGWLEEVTAAITYRPSAWTNLTGKPGALHPLDICRAVQPILDRNPDAIFISDGGEVGQWAQAGVTARRRLINGVAGSIGSALPFAIAARTVEPDAPIIAVSGDGAIGFHIAEIDTAVRHDLPCVVIVGNDAAWNAEHQIQLREYGADRAHSCRLLPTRYDEVARAFGGHGELVTEAAQLAPAIERSIASRKPAIVNVMIEGHAAPIVRRTG